MVGFLPILAEGLRCGSAPFLAGVCRCGWVVLCHSWLGAWGVGPRHSWLGSAAGGGGLCAVFVQCVWCALSGVVVCGVLFVVPPLVPLVFVLVPVWMPPLRERLRVLVLVFRVVGVPSPSRWPWCVWLAPRHVLVRALCGVCVSWACGCVCVCVCVALCCLLWRPARGVWVQVCGLWAMPYLFWFLLSADMVTMKVRKYGPANV